MRKELLVYVSTVEKNEEIAVTSIGKHRNCVLITGSTGKFTANRQELIEALNAIEQFDKEINPVIIEEKIVKDDNVEEVEYGE